METSKKAVIRWFCKKASLRGKPESSYFKMFWTPAFAGVTLQVIGTMVL
jgi:hypothetical protein